MAVVIRHPNLGFFFSVFKESRLRRGRRKEVLHLTAGSLGYKKKKERASFAHGEQDVFFISPF